MLRAPGIDGRRTVPRIELPIFSGRRTVPRNELPIFIGANCVWNQSPGLSSSPGLCDFFLSPPLGGGVDGWDLPGCLLLPLSQALPSVCGCCVVKKLAIRSVGQKTSEGGGEVAGQKAPLRGCVGLGLVAYITEQVCLKWAYGVVVSHPLCMRKALGSIRTVSISQPARAADNPIT